MKRRDFIGAAAASIFAPKFGKWYQQGSGIIVRDLAFDGEIALPVFPSVGARRETDYLPTPGAPKFANVRIKLIKHGMSIRESHRELGIALPRLDFLTPAQRDRLLDYRTVIPERRP